MRLLTTLLLLISVNALGQTKGALENPSPGSFSAFSPGAKIAIRKVVGNTIGASAGQAEAFNLTPISNLSVE